MLGNGLPVGRWDFSWVLACWWDFRGGHWLASGHCFAGGLYWYLPRWWDFSWALACRWDFRAGLCHASGQMWSLPCWWAVLGNWFCWKLPIMSPDCTSNLAYSQHFHRRQERFIQNLPAGKKCIRIFLLLHFLNGQKLWVDPIAVTSRWEQIMHITCKAAFNRIVHDLQNILHSFSVLGEPENRSWYIQDMHFGCIQSIPPNVFKSCKN